MESKIRTPGLCLLSIHQYKKPLIPGSLTVLFLFIDMSKFIKNYCGGPLLAHHNYNSVM